MKTIELPFGDANELTSELGRLADIMRSAEYVSKMASDANGRCIGMNVREAAETALNDYYMACRASAYLNEYAAKIAEGLAERIEVRRE